MRLWRISRFASAAQAVDGEGARLYPGRWNPAGVPVVYASTTLSLAALELLVNAEVHHLKGPFFAFSVEVPDALLETPADKALPPDWRDLARPSGARAFGGAWASSGRSVGLLVPSVVVRRELNCVLNPRHPRFYRLRIGGPEPFAFDPRLLAPRPVRK